MSYIPGQGIKKPLNMLESPVYPDIKQNPIQFKSSGKFWNVDVGKVILETEANTQLIENAVLSRSYRDNIDKYGQQSHQEKITVFRPPLQNSYEDFQALSRLPAQAYAIEGRINPSTVTDNGTSAYKVNNNAIPELNKHITDKIKTDSWFPTYYDPIDLPLDNSILPDYETNIPTHSVFSGFVTPVTIDSEPKIDENKVILPKLQTSTHTGYNITNEYNLSLQNQTAYIPVGVYEDKLPITPIHSGYKQNAQINGENGYENLNLVENRPHISISSGNNPNIHLLPKVDTDNIHLERNYPVMSISSGFTPINTVDGETQFDTIALPQQITPLLAISNPGSEIGFQKRLSPEGYTNSVDHIKLKENPRVPNTSGVTFNYRDDDNIFTNKIHARRKLEPLKSYNTGLNSGTILKSGLDVPTIGGRFFANKKDYSLQQI